MVKCDKCGAEIPDGASFCPGCGAPQPEKKPAPAQTSPPQQTYYQPPPSRRSGVSGINGIIGTFFSKQMIIIGLFIGVLIAWITKVAGDIMNFPLYTLEYSIVNIVNYTFMAGVGFLLLGGGFLNCKLSKYIRIGLIVAGGLILAYNI
jgi:hypothetical protein